MHVAKTSTNLNKVTFFLILHTNFELHLIKIILSMSSFSLASLSYDQTSLLLNFKYMPAYFSTNNETKPKVFPKYYQRHLVRGNAILRKILLCIRASVLTKKRVSWWPHWWVALVSLAWPVAPFWPSYAFAYNFNHDVRIKLHLHTVIRVIEVTSFIIIMLNVR